MRLKRRSPTDEPIKDDQLKVNLVDIDPREEPPENWLTTRENIRKIQNGVQSPHTTRIGASQISKDEDDKIEFTLNIGHRSLIHDL